LTTFLVRLVVHLSPFANCSPPFRTLRHFICHRLLVSRLLLHLLILLPLLLLLLLLLFLSHSLNCSHRVASLARQTLLFNPHYPFSIPILILISISRCTIRITIITIICSLGCSASIGDSLIHTFQRRRRRSLPVPLFLSLLILTQINCSSYRSPSSPLFSTLHHSSPTHHVLLGATHITSSIVDSSIAAFSPQIDFFFLHDTLTLFLTAFQALPLTSPSQALLSPLIPLLPVLNAKSTFFLLIQSFKSISTNVSINASHSSVFFTCSDELLFAKSNQSHLNFIYLTEPFKVNLFIIRLFLTFASFGIVRKG
jgi:hypothetical protein